MQDFDELYIFQNKINMIFEFLAQSYPEKDI